MSALLTMVSITESRFADVWLPQKRLLFLSVPTVRISLSQILFVYMGRRNFPSLRTFSLRQNEATVMIIKHTQFM